MSVPEALATRESGTGGADAPPEWSGDGLFTDYERRVRLWEVFTKTPENQRGPRLLSRLRGAAWEACDPLDLEDLRGEDGLELVLQQLRQRFKPEAETELFDLLEEVLFGEARKAEEPLNDFVQRMTNGFRRLEKKAVTLPATVQGFLLLKKCRLRQESRIAVMTLSAGSLEISAVVKALKRFNDEFTRTDSAKPTTTRPVFAAEEVDTSLEEATWQNPLPSTDDLVEDVLIEEALDALSNEAEEFTEAEAMEVLIAYRDARQSAQQNRLNRGFRPTTPASTTFRTSSGKSFGGPGSKRVDIKDLIARTRCRICGEKGHWGRECPKKRNSGSSGTLSGAASSQPNFFVYMNEVYQLDFEGPNEQLVGCGVVDTGCAKFIMGKETLRLWQRQWEKYGMKIEVIAGPAQKFRFGNDECVSTQEVALLPVGLGGKDGIVRVYVIPGNVPLLVSQEFMREMGTVIDLVNDKIEFKKMGVTADLVNQRSHITMRVDHFGPNREHAMMHAAALASDYKDDGSIPRDYWEEREEQWVRHHVVARRTLFSPNDAHDGPSEEQVHGRRCTKFRYLGDEESHVQELHDDWHGHRTMPQPWVGQTIFTKQLSGAQRTSVPTTNVESHAQGQLPHVHRMPGAHDAAPEQEEPGVVLGVPELSRLPHHDIVDGVPYVGGAQEGGEEGGAGTRGGGHQVPPQGHPKVGERLRVGREVHDLQRAAARDPTARTGQSTGPGDRSPVRGQRSGDAGRRVPGGPGHDPEAVQRDRLRDELASRDDGQIAEGAGGVRGGRDGEVDALDREEGFWHPGEGEGAGDGDVTAGRAGQGDGVRSLKRGERKRLLGESRRAQALVAELYPEKDGAKKIKVSSAPEDVGEVCSPPRVVPVACHQGMIGTLSLDLETGYNLLTTEGQRLAVTELEKAKPRVLILSPPCGPFSIMQNATPGFSPERAERLRQGVKLLGFCMQLAQWQVKRGAYFIFEHPASARSWQLPAVRRVADLPGVTAVTGDLCEYGLTSAEGTPVRKRTRWMGNVPGLEEVLGKKCSGNHEHQPLEGTGPDGVARTLRAQRYSPGTVRALLKLVRKAKEEDDRKRKEEMVVLVQDIWKEEDQTILEQAEEAPVLPIEDEEGGGEEDEETEGEEEGRSERKQKEDAEEEERSHDAEVIKKVMKIHENMGHPSNKTLIRVLTHGKAKRRYVLAAARLECGACQRGQRPRGPLPSRAPPTSYTLGDVVGVDIFYVRVTMDGQEEMKVPILNIICWGTDLQMCVRITQEDGTTLRKAYRETWLRHYGKPRVLVLDQGRNFSKGIFPERAEADGSTLQIIPTEAPWRNGKTERAGGEWKKTFYRTAEDVTIQTTADLDELIDAVNISRNDLPGRSGFSAYQRVLGRVPALPEGIEEEDGAGHLGVISRLLNGDEALIQSVGMRAKARRAAREVDSRARWQRALLRARRDPKEDFQPGMPIWFWRVGSDKKRTVQQCWNAGVCIQASGAIVWVASRGTIVKCARSHVRHYTLEDMLSREMVQEDMLKMEKYLEKQDAKYEDLTGQDDPEEYVPPEQEEPSPESPRMEEEHTDISDEDFEKECAEIGRRLHQAAEDKRKGEMPPAYPSKQRKCDDEEPVMITDTAYFLKTPSRTEVRMKDLDKEEKAEFLQAKEKEWKGMVQSGAVRVLSGEETERVLASKAEYERIMESRFLDTKKPDDSQKRGWKAKSRLIVKGFTDPDLLDLETYAPTLSREGFMMVMQLVASHGHKLELGDVEQAFNNGDPMNREKGPVYIRPPRNGIPGVPEGRLIELMKTVYGLADGPKAWRTSFLQEAAKVGFKPSAYEPCVWILQKEGRYRGCLGVAVDDVAGGGDDEWQRAVAELRRRFPFKWETNLEGKGKFCGRYVQQLPDGTITVNQGHYARALEYVPMTNARKQQEADAVTEEERAALRRALGSLGWLGRESRPDLIGPISLLQGRITTARVSDVKETNRVIRLAKDFADMNLQVRPIPPEELTFVSYGDASWANAHGNASQAGHIILAVDRRVVQGQRGMASVLSWRSHKVKRLVESAPHAELLGMSKAQASGDWLRALWCESIGLCDAKGWEAFSGKPRLTTITDSRGNYDHLHNETCGSTEDRRAAIDMAIMRQEMAKSYNALRWTDAKAQLADGLTKMRGDNDLLRAMCKSGTLVLVEEAYTMQLKQQEREERWNRRGGGRAKKAKNYGPTAAAE